MHGGATLFAPMVTLRSTVLRLQGGARALAGQVAVAIANRAQRLAGDVVPRVESAMQRVEGASSVERLAAQREAFRLALAEYLLGPLSIAAQAQPPQGVLHLTRLVETRLEQLCRYREFWREDDPTEAVHQLRVASRRLRAFVDLFAQFFDSSLVQQTRRQLKVVTGAVRDLRDADVLLSDLEQRLGRVQADEERAALDEVLKHARKRRKRLANRAAKRLKSFDPDALSGGLRRMLDQLALRARSPSATYEVLAGLSFERVLDETRRAFPKFAHLPRAEDLHAFRLRVKRLRYSAEFVEPVLGERFSAIHRQAKKIQELLGDHQDRIVFGQALERYRDGVRRNEFPQVARGLDRLIVSVRGEREQLFERFGAEYGHSTDLQLFTGSPSTGSQGG